MTAPRRPLSGRPSGIVSRLWGRMLFRALVMQAAAAAAVFAVAHGYVTATGTPIPLLGLFAAQGIGAALLGLRFGLDRWWALIQVLLPPALFAARALPFPPWAYGLAFVALVLVYWNSAGDRVPLYLTNRRTWAALAALLPEAHNLSFIDLGSGLGGTLADLARRRPDARWVGVESAPLPFAVAWLRLKGIGRLAVDLRYGDMWRQDLAPYDVVYCFLSPAPMPALFDKARREMRPGSLFISNSFTVPGFAADEVVDVDDRRRTRLHVWRMGESPDGAASSTIGKGGDIA